MKAPSPAPKSPTPTAPEPAAPAPVLELFSDEEDDFYQELTGFTGEETTTDDRQGEAQHEAEELEAEPTPPTCQDHMNPTKTSLTFSGSRNGTTLILLALAMKVFTKT